MLKILHIVGLSFFWISSVLAETELPIAGTISKELILQHQAQQHKEIKLLEYDLSREVQQELYQHAQRQLTQSNSLSFLGGSPLPPKIQLGMGKVPVLDQGWHSSCTTFAMTAALDAALKQGDYVSQLCLLQLGNYLESQDAYVKSGWKGSSISVIKDRIEQYGIMTIADQHYYGCGGYRLYPTYFFTPSAGMTSEQYQMHRIQPLQQQVRWSFLFRKNYSRKGRADPRVTFLLKQALSSGARVVISTFLPQDNWGDMGAVGKHHYNNDTWILTPEIVEALSSAQKMDGHTMIITGYDDEATLKDNAGHLHKGLFTLRNSWSRWAGDWGDYYMSYDYAEVLINQGLMVSPTATKA